MDLALRHFPLGRDDGLRRGVDAWATSPHQLRRAERREDHEFEGIEAGRARDHARLPDGVREELRLTAMTGTRTSGAPEAVTNRLLVHETAHAAIRLTLGRSARTLVGTTRTLAGSVQD